MRRSMNPRGGDDVTDGRTRAIKSSARATKYDTAAEMRSPVRRRWRDVWNYTVRSQLSLIQDS